MMVRVDYDPERDVDWDSFFTQQVGHGAHFVGYDYPQRGAGLGSILNGLLRYLIPLGKTAARAVGREGLATGSRVIGGVLEGRDFKESLKRESRRGLKNLVNKAADRMNQQQDGSGRRRRISKKPPSNIKRVKRKAPATTKRRRVAKRPRRGDILGLY
jgi:hypothetical protein